LHRPDQRGYGQSPVPEGVEPYRIKALVGDIAALIEEIGAPLPVVAHDWGAAVGYALAIGRPDLVSALVVVNGVHPGPFQRELALGGAQSEASAYIDYLRDPGAEARLSTDGFAGLRRLFAARWICPG
jgi:alpha/beta hydrolase fold.